MKALVYTESVLVNSPPERVSRISEEGHISRPDLTLSSADKENQPPGLASSRQSQKRHKQNLLGDTSVPPQGKHWKKSRSERNMAKRKLKPGSITPPRRQRPYPRSAEVSPDRWGFIHHVQNIPGAIERLWIWISTSKKAQARLKEEEEISQHI